MGRRFRGLLLTLLEMPADVPALEVRAVGGERFTREVQDAGLSEPVHRHIEQAVGLLERDEQMEGPAEGVVVRSLGHPAVGQPVRAVGQERFGAAVTFLLVLADDQAREQLWQGKIVPAERAGVSREDFRCKCVRCPHHAARGFAGFHPAGRTKRKCIALADFQQNERVKTEQSWTIKAWSPRNRVRSQA